MWFGSQYHNIVIELDTRAASDLTLAYTINRDTGKITANSNALATKPDMSSLPTAGVLSGMEILAVYVQLDTAERRLKAQAAQTVRFVYSQGATYSTVSTDAGATKEVSNFFNHPVTRLLWAWRAASATSEDRHEWFEFGAYRATKVQVGKGAPGPDAYHRVQDVVPEIRSI